MSLRLCFYGSRTRRSVGRVPLVATALRRLSGGTPPSARAASARQRVEVRLGERRPALVALAEEPVGPAARPVARQQVVRQVRVDEREAPPGVDERGLGGERGLAAARPDAGEV